VRPHPEFVKRFSDKIHALETLFADDIDSGRLILQTDFSSNSTVYDADVVVTDWSSIAQEFSYTTKKPSIFVNTPMKIMNHNWQAIKAQPLDITLRDEIGVSIDVDALSTIGGVARNLIENPGAWEEQITQIIDDNIFNLGHSAKAAVDYIQSALDERKYRGELLLALDARDAGTATGTQMRLVEEAESRRWDEEAATMRAQADEMEVMARSLRARADEMAANHEPSPKKEEEMAHA
jgi:CDP-glycerol glycerophosphotransferase (TagB/SpsB family)